MKSRFPLFSIQRGPDRVFSLQVGNVTHTVRILDEQRPGSLARARNITADGRLNSLARADGKILVWGDFSEISGATRSGVALLSTDGAVDESFHPPEILLDHRRIEGLGAGPSNFNSNSRIGVARFQNDGTLDPRFASLKFDGSIR